MTGSYTLAELPLDGADCLQAMRIEPGKGRTNRTLWCGPGLFLLSAGESYLLFFLCLPRRQVSPNFTAFRP